jgi:hypothetical protein
LEAAAGDGAGDLLDQGRPFYLDGPGDAAQVVAAQLLRVLADVGGGERGHRASPYFMGLRPMQIIPSRANNNPPAWHIIPEMQAQIAGT